MGRLLHPLNFYKNKFVKSVLHSLEMARTCLTCISRVIHRNKKHLQRLQDGAWQSTAQRQTNRNDRSPRFALRFALFLRLVLILPLFAHHRPLTSKLFKNVVLAINSNFSHLCPPGGLLLLGEHLVTWRVIDRGPCHVLRSWQVFRFLLLHLRFSVLLLQRLRLLLVLHLDLVRVEAGVVRAVRRLQTTEKWRESQRGWNAPMRKWIKINFRFSRGRKWKT